MSQTELYLGEPYVLEVGVQAPSAATGALQAATGLTITGWLARTIGGSAIAPSLDATLVARSGRAHFYAAELAADALAAALADDVGTVIYRAFKVGANRPVYAPVTVRAYRYLAP